MKAFIRHDLFTQSNLDSGSLTMLGSVVHNFSEPGNYQGRVVRGTETTASFRLTVSDECPAVQVNIDLATLASPAQSHVVDESVFPEQRRHFAVNPKGYAVFYVSQGRGGYATLVGKPEEGYEARLFDSRELREGDMFAATIIRPGIYSVVNVVTGAQGEISVAYPRIGTAPYRPPPPVFIECTENALTPDRIEIEPAQGQVYRCRVSSRIAIQLARPDGAELA
jgi:hypothetical protein